MEQKNMNENRTRGAIMLESLIVYPVTLFLLFFILAVFSVLYQQWNIQVIANETATRMAHTYRLDQADESSGFVTVDELVEVGPYRYVGNLVTKKMEKSIQERVSTYAQWRLAKTTYTKSIGDPAITAVVIPDSLGRRHLEVTITGTYSVPFGEALSYFGFNSTITYETKAYAECIDIIDYVNFVDYVQAQTNLKKFGSKTIALIDALWSLFDNILDE